MPRSGLPAESLLLKNGGDPVGAFFEGQILFNTSLIYIRAFAEHYAGREGFNVGLRILHQQPNQLHGS